MSPIVRWLRSISLSVLVLGSAVGCGPSPPPAKATAPDKTHALPAEAPFEKDLAGATLKLASSVWAPFTDEADKAHIALDLVHEALKRANIAHETSIMDFGDAIEGIHHGRFDGSEALWKTREREEFILYSDAYLENRLVLLARSGTDVSAKKLGDLAGKKVGLVESYAYGAEVDNLKGVDFQRGPDEPTNLRLLLRGDLDYILVDELLVYRMFSDQKQKAELLLAAGTTPMVSRGLHFGIRKDLPGAADIIARFNAEVLELAKDGTYNQILGVRWIATDTDNDGIPELVATGRQVGTAPPETHYRIAGPSTPTLKPHFVIEGRAYESWQSVPQNYKVPEPGTVESFQPALGLVLVEF